MSDHEQDHIIIAFGAHSLRLRPPMAGELDIALLQRLYAQLAHHMSRMDTVDPDVPEPALQVDRHMRLALAACGTIAQRTRACLLACVVGDCPPLPEPDDESSTRYMSVAAELLAALGERARLGESRPLSG